MALVTVVIPVWDEHVKFLPRCLAALQDDPTEKRIVVVDNASAVPIRVPEGIEQVRLPKRQTVGQARNAGLAQVATPFVVFADADDELVAGSVARSIRLLTRRSAKAGVVGRSEVHELDGTVRGGRTPSVSLTLGLRVCPFLDPYLWLLRFRGSLTSTVLRTETVRRAGGFGDLDLGEDWLLATRLSRRGGFVYTRAHVRRYHRHPATVRGRESDKRAARPEILAEARNDGATPQCLCLPLRWLASWSQALCSPRRR